jgi:hypothetical protein
MPFLKTKRFGAIFASNLNFEGNFHDPHGHLKMAKTVRLSSKKEYGRFTRL